MLDVVVRPWQVGFGDCCEGAGIVSKQKERKKKERERRVAQKKLAAAAQRRALEKAHSDTPKSVTEMHGQAISQSIPKVGRAVANTNKPFNHRRTGGG
jgi:hypothetical protein